MRDPPQGVRGDTADALARLDGCGAEAELVALAKDCLAAEPEDRPRDAGVVAERMTAYLAGVQDRVQAAERERAVAVPGPSRNGGGARCSSRLAASVLALTTLGGLSTTYYLQRGRRGRAPWTGSWARQSRSATRPARTPRTSRGGRWRWPLWSRRKPRGDAGARDRLLALHAEIQAGLDAALRDKALLDRLVDIRRAEADDPDGSATDAAYADAFLEAGIDLAACRPPRRGRRSGPARRPWRWPWPRHWTTGRPFAGRRKRMRPERPGSAAAPRRRPRPLAK